ncbi:MAG: glycosyltransferase [Verrucomicrobiota bacterium]
MNVLFISNLYPNSLEPSRGVFNEYQILHLTQRCPVKVIAPIAWFPIRGRYAPVGRLPDREILAGIDVHHPRHFYFPKVGRYFNAGLYSRGTASTVTAIHKEFPFDVIFANWTYPDACGVARLAAQFKVPFVVSVSGSDAHLYLEMRDRVRQILQMFDRAAAITTRSADLRNMLLAHAVNPRKVHVVYNGVDNRRFRSESRSAARQQLGWHPTEQVVLFVGRLSPEKGADTLLRAFAHARRYYELAAHLIIVGDGPERRQLTQLAIELGLTGSRLAWAGWKKPEEISQYFNAADVLCLPSQNEGVANVVLEAFACGLPVVATAVGGIPEVMTEETGILAAPAVPESLAHGLHQALQRVWDADRIRQHAMRFNWQANAEQMEAILKEAVVNYPRESH